MTRKGGCQNRTANAIRSAAHPFKAKCSTVTCAVLLDEETKKIVIE